MVRVAPRASRSEIVGDYDGALRVRIAAPPVDGAANAELIKILARALKTPRKSVEIFSGHGSRSKTIRIHNVGRSTIEKLILY